MDQRFSEPLKLFNALVYEIQKLTNKSARKLNVVLLPGRSYVEQPMSVSAQYQEYFRQKIRSSLDASSIKVMDLAAHLRALHDKGIQKLYYPNEGHLTPLGHQYVADYLAVQIKNIKSNP